MLLRYVCILFRWCLYKNLRLTEYTYIYIRTLLSITQAKGCWKQNEYNYKNRNQKATRWYAEYLTNKGNHEKTPRPTDVPTHRHSSDSSVDIFLGKALEDRYAKAPSKLSPIEQNLLLWNTKNAEYALGANISDLSMKYWDAGEF